MKEHRVRADDVARIVWEVISAVINNCLECPDCSKEGRLAIVESCDGKTVREANSIDRYRLQRMVVEGTVSEWDVDIMVHGMNMLCWKSSTDSQEQGVASELTV